MRLRFQLSMAEAWSSVKFCRRSCAVLTSMLRSFLLTVRVGLGLGLRAIQLAHSSTPLATPTLLPHSRTHLAHSSSIMDMATLRHSKSASAQTGRAAAGIISRLVRVRVRVRG